LELHEADLVGLDPALAGGAGSRDQPAIEPIGPGVVRALQRLALTRATADDRAAVPAHVEERTEDVVPVTHEHDRDVADPGGGERARFGHLSRVPDVLPGATEDPLPLELQNSRIGVPAPRQAPHV